MQSDKDIQDEINFYQTHRIYPEQVGGALPQHLVYTKEYYERMDKKRADERARNRAELERIVNDGFAQMRQEEAKKATTLGQNTTVSNTEPASGTPSQTTYSAVNTAQSNAANGTTDSGYASSYLSSSGTPASGMGINSYSPTTYDANAYSSPYSSINGYMSSYASPYSSGMGLSNTSDMGANAYSSPYSSINGYMGSYASPYSSGMGLSNPSDIGANAYSSPYSSVNGYMSSYTSPYSSGMGLSNPSDIGANAYSSPYSSINGYMGSYASPYSSASYGATSYVSPYPTFANTPFIEEEEEEEEEEVAKPSKEQLRMHEFMKNHRSDELQKYHEDLYKDGNCGGVDEHIADLIASQESVTGCKNDKTGKKGLNAYNCVNEGNSAFGAFQLQNGALTDAKYMKKLSKKKFVFTGKDNINSHQDLLKNPIIQENVLCNLFNDAEKYLKEHGIQDKYENALLNIGDYQIPITKNMFGAIAHRWGARGTARYLNALSEVDNNTYQYNQENCYKNASQGSCDGISKRIINLYELENFINKK